MNKNDKLNSDALEYHSKGRKGKLEVTATKSLATQYDLSLAYSPGVAEPCRMIAEKEDLIYEYTSKGNLVAVVSNGTAVLGLGNIGPHASKPVMEGKAVLFKKFADIDAFDLELNAPDPEDVIRTCQILEPTFGGINLEDIKAPECFYIEEELKKRLKIPVFHDDQHGTAIICGAAFLNALEIIGKKIEDVKCVFVGGGAACISSAKMFISLGVKKENLIMTDLDGVIYEGRTVGMNSYKAEFAVKTERRTLREAMVGADAIVGLSAKGAFSADMIAKMERDPIIFAMANPDPEVLPEEVFQVRKDAIMATGRSDYPNQVNNVLCFPFIFRGALDVYSTTINEEMKRAAVKAIADLAKQEMPESVVSAYGGKRFQFGRDYLLPKPFDQRALLWVAPAVAEAAMNSGVARKKINIERYRNELEKILGVTYTFIKSIKSKINHPKKIRIVFPEGEHPTLLRAAQIIVDQKIGEPILLGDEEKIKKISLEMGLKDLLKHVKIIHPSQSEHYSSYCESFFNKRARKGMTLSESKILLKEPNYYGPMMLEEGDAEIVLNGVSQSYPDTIRPALQCVGVSDQSKLAGLHLVLLKKRMLWLADTTVNINPTAEELLEITTETIKFASKYMISAPRVALLSFSNFGSNDHPHAKKMRRALELIKARFPDLVIDGEMQLDTALDPEVSQNYFPFNQVPGDANILIFPDLQSSNAAHKLISKLTEAEMIGPILLGMKKPVYVLSQNSSVTEVVNMATIAAMDVR